MNVGVAKIKAHANYVAKRHFSNAKYPAAPNYIVLIIAIMIEYILISN